MKVGLDFRPALLGGSGIGRYANELARALYADAGLVHPRLFGVKWAKDAAHLDRWFESPGVTLSRGRFPSRLLPLASAMGLGADRCCGNVEIFHYTDFVYPPLSRARSIVTLHDVAFALDVAYHGPRFRRDLVRRVRRQLHLADWILTPSEFSAQEACRVGLLNDLDRVLVTPLGGEHLLRVSQAPSPSVERDRDQYFLMVGTLEPRKNHVRVLRAFQRLVERGFEGKLRIIGSEGWLLEELDQERKQWGDHPQVIWEGKVDDRTLRDRYQGALALVYPSLYEGFGLPIAEAFHLGVPVITSSLGAMAEVAGSSALGVDPFDETSIWRAMDRLAGSQEDREDWGKRGKTRAVELSWAIAAKQTSALYQR